MYECRVGIKIIWHHWSTTTITAMANHSRCQRKRPPNAPHKALRPTPSFLLDGRWPPELADTNFKRLRGCMALITIRCYGDASSPEQRSALRAIHPLNTPNIISACSGDHCPSIWRVGMRRNALCGALGGHFCCRRPWLWRCFVACRSTKHFFPVELRHSGYCQKVLVLSKTILALYWGRDIEIKDKRR